MTIKKLDVDNRTQDQKDADDKLRQWHEKWRDSHRWCIRRLADRGNKYAMASRTHATSHPPQGWSPDTLTQERRAELRAWIAETVLAICDDPPGNAITRSWLQRFLQARPNCPDEVFWAPDYWLAQELLNPTLKQLCETYRIEEYEAKRLDSKSMKIPAFRKVSLLDAIARAAQDGGGGGS